MLQISGLPGSFFVTRAGSVLAGRSFCQISSGRLQHPDGVAQALRHLGLAVEAHDPLGLGEQRLGLREVILAAAELRVPPARDFPGQLQVLDLVLADRHQVGAVEQDVGGHQDRVVEQPGRNAFEPLRLIFELRHPLQLAERRHRGQQPLQLGVLRHVRLHEQDRRAPGRSPRPAGRSPCPGCAAPAWPARTCR